MSHILILYTIYDTLCIVIIISFSYSSSFRQPIHNGATPRPWCFTNNCARGEYHSISKSAKQRCPDEEFYIACIVTCVHSEPHLPCCTTCSHTHSKQAFGTHLKTYLSLDSVAIYKGAFYTRSKFTLKVLAEYGCTFLLSCMGEF